VAALKIAEVCKLVQFSKVVVVRRVVGDEVLEGELLLGAFTEEI
jgi:hypothetical protein